jgi:hypothetical protein
MNNNKISLKKLLSKSEDNRLNIIEIPMLQRDYAQGRTDDKTSELRRKFIGDMLGALLSKKNSLHLDFIYGPIKNGVFRPIDGQQRLTTLFLLYWFVAVKAEETNEVFEYLKNFRYKVRATSQEFIDSILDPDNLKGVELTKKDLKDAKWYYSAWNYDPTVQGMLETIDTINCLSKSSKLPPWESVYKNLDNITLSLLPMDKFGLGDELFMRMNARGLALTDFENFKAWLQDYVTDKKYLEKESDWLDKLDTTWSELICKYSLLNDKGDKDLDKLFDQYYLRFFKGMAQFAIANSAKKEKEERISDLSDKNKAILLSQYKEMECFNEECLEDCFKILDFISTNKNNEILKGFYFEEEKNEDLFYNFIKDQTYKDKILFYTLIQYLKKNGWTINEENRAQFNQYKRVIRNLVENTDINNDNFINLVKSINELSNVANMILDTIKNDDYEILYFDKTQIKEERLKAKLIVENIKWENEFNNYEKHLYFYGQINFLLEMSNNNFEDFKKYGVISKAIFCDDIIEREDYLLQRALLTQGNYLKNFKFNEEIPNDKDAKNNKSLWRNIFNDSERLETLKKLLDELSEYQSENYEENLENIIEKYKNNNFKYKWCNDLLCDIKYHLVLRLTDDFIVLHNCKGGEGYYFVYPDRVNFYEKIKEELPKYIIDIQTIECEDFLTTNYPKIKISLKNGLIIALEKGCFSDSPLILGVLSCSDLKINDNIFNSLNKWNEKKYLNKNSTWACFRQDDWNENKDNPQKYVEEIKQLYLKLQSICSDS